jgi:hypothetical protein
MTMPGIRVEVCPLPLPPKDWSANTGHLTIHGAPVWNQNGTRGLSFLMGFTTESGTMNRTNATTNSTLTTDNGTNH